MPAHPPDPVVVAEARRLAAEDLDRDLGRVADMLAERGHRGPDGEPVPPRTAPNLDRLPGHPCLVDGRVVLGGG